MVFCNIKGNTKVLRKNGHNPYFNRWFSAIEQREALKVETSVTILILIDGFLQFFSSGLSATISRVTILILIDGFMQYR